MEETRTDFKEHMARGFREQRDHRSGSLRRVCGIGLIARHVDFGLTRARRGRGQPNAARKNTDRRSVLIDAEADTRRLPF
jgi:hypothetical protein